MFISKIGKIIKESPFKREYIQKEIGVSRNTLSSWCMGKTHPNAPELFRLARLLERDVHDFYEWEENK
ncbi:helix-turn-helix domain-containing protein [Bacillus badius]|uniref:helix-turn-helix transcriptional regulator n=1 Tax=Bacillus badius TaxID=1455 RepID=UPI001CC1B448|nr:helix-turn-helix transcriptional regulator [Bacillus badius]UAT29487.1 helix-turn-helix domain-containing protein [Bacillus badius]